MKAPETQLNFLGRISGFAPCQSELADRVWCRSRQADLHRIHWDSFAAALVCSGCGEVIQQLSARSLVALVSGCYKTADGRRLFAEGVSSHE